LVTYHLAPEHRLLTWLAPPAHVLCLLFALAAGGYGFLKYHFGRGHLLVAAALLLAGALVNGLVLFKQRFPGLEDYYARDEATRVALVEDDFGTLFDQEVAGADDANARRLARAYDNLRARGRALAKALPAGRTVKVFEAPPSEDLNRLRAMYRAV